MAEADAVATAIVAGGSPDKPDAAKTQNQSTPAPDWGTEVPDELKEVVKAKGWKSPADAVKSYVELEKHSSRSVQDMSAEERERFLKRLGRPESADGLELGTIPDTLPHDPNADKDLRQIVWEMQALPMKQQAKRLQEWAVQKAVNAYAAQKAAQEKQLSEQETALRQAWAASYDANSANVEKLLKLGGEEFVQFMNAGPGKNPVVRKGLYAISKLLTDETLVQGKPVEPLKRTAEEGMVVDFSASPELQGAGRYGRR